MNLYRTTKNNLGFTLIELLVVVAIIGILASVVLASLNTARAKARDASRITSIRQIQTALELYFNANGSYPSSPDLDIVTALTTPLTPTHIPNITNTTGSRYYTASQPTPNWYAIYMAYETKTPCYRCAGPSCMSGQGWWGVNMCQ